jgi:hypothetical protein
MYSNEEQLEILINFAATLIKNTVEPPFEISNDEFWNLFQPLEERTVDVNNSESRS